MVVVEARRMSTLERMLPLDLWCLCFRFQTTPTPERVETTLAYINTQRSLNNKILLLPTMFFKCKCTVSSFVTKRQSETPLPWPRWTLPTISIGTLYLILPPRVFRTAAVVLLLHLVDQWMLVQPQSIRSSYSKMYLNPRRWIPSIPSTILIKAIVVLSHRQESINCGCPRPILAFPSPVQVEAWQSRSAVCHQRQPRQAFSSIQLEMLTRHLHHQTELIQHGMSSTKLYVNLRLSSGTAVFRRGIRRTVVLGKNCDTLPVPCSAPLELHLSPMSLLPRHGFTIATG